jgi:acetyl-CoA carboxylase biotin carboxyl carrier protein
MNDGAPVQSRLDEVFEAVCRGATRLLETVPGPLRRTKVQCGDTSVEVEWSELDARPTTPVPALPGSVPTTSEAATDGQEDGTRHYVRSPMVGTFFHAPEPGAPPFVAVGDVVEARQQVGIVEAMKLMNRIEADQPGTVVEILVSNAAAVEYDQPLIVLAGNGA